MQQQGAVAEAHDGHPTADFGAQHRKRLMECPQSVLGFIQLAHGRQNESLAAPALPAEAPPRERSRNVSVMRKAATRPETNVRAAINQIAAFTPSASAVTP